MSSTDPKLFRPLPEPASEELATALERATLRRAREPAEGLEARPYRVGELAVVLAAFAASMLLLDAQGLLTWAQRLDVGPVRSAALGALGPLHAGMDRAQLTWLRAQLARAGDQLAHQLGTEEDPLISGGWENPLLPEARVESVEPPADEAEPVPAAPAPAPVVGEDVTAVLLVGDSMIAGSLGATVARAVARDRRLRVVRAVQTATGLARPEVYDWMKVVPLLLERDQPRLIVCSFGANDGTNLLERGRQLDFGEERWRRAYRGHVVAMMRALTAGGARVLWLGLPPMRDANFSERAQYLNGIFAESARKVPRVEFLELDMLVSDARGEYTTFHRGPEGRYVRFRMDDGVHYSPAGARAITGWVVDWLYERLRKLPAQGRAR